MRKMRGFTLMEILVSLVILTTLSLGLCGIFMLAQKGTSTGDDKVIASQVLEKALGELKDAPYTEFQKWASEVPIDKYTRATVPELKDGLLTVTVAPGTVAVAEYKELTAAVIWTNVSGITKSLSIATGIYRASNG